MRIVNRTTAPNGAPPKAVTKTTYILRLDKGEEFIMSVQDFCSENDIKNGQIVALGSTRELQLAYFNIDEKKYETRDFSEFLEIVNITGNISLKDGKPFCHAHGTFSRSDMATIGGHIMRAVISATCEIKLEAGEGQMERKFDDETGLYLLN